MIITNSIRLKRGVLFGGYLTSRFRCLRE